MKTGRGEIGRKETSARGLGRLRARNKDSPTWRDGPPKSFSLVYLARHRERVVPKAELREVLWRSVVVTEAYEHAYSYRSRPGAGLAHLCMLATSAGELERAQAALLAAEGDLAGAVRQQRQAARLCLDANAPLACAETRRSLSRVLLAAGDTDAAEVELGAAISLFRRAGADGQVALCERLRQA